MIKLRKGNLSTITTEWKRAEQMGEGLASDKYPEQLGRGLKKRVLRQAVHRPSQFGLRYGGKSQWL